MRPKRRPPRPKHPKFTHFHRSGLRFGRFPAQHRSIGGVGRPRRDRRAWLRCPWAVAGPGRASRRRTEPENSDQAPLVWRAPEGSAAVPVGGGGAWPDRETTRQARPQYTRHHWCGGPRRDRRAWLRRPWAVAGPGRASRSTTPSRRLACGDLAGGPPPTAQHGLTKHTRRPKHPWRPTTTTTRPTRRAAHAGTGRGSG